MDASDAWRIALAVFLILTALGLTFVLVRVGGTFGRINAMLEGVTAEVLPMLTKVSTSLDHVNGELEKVGHITDHAVDAADSVDATVRTVSSAVTAPVKAVAGVSAGIRQT